jgi:ribosomal-protein-serine acetyltransferase
MFYLEVDEQLDLRLLTEAHTQALFELIEQNREHLRVWLPWVDSTRTLEDTRQFVRFALRQHARSSAMTASIWQQGRMVGLIGYNYIDHLNRQTELGYWLGAAYQGQGIMTAACRAMIRYAFVHLEMARVEIRCAVENRRSRAIPERLGFELDGIASQLDWHTDRYWDTVVYSMAAVHWMQQEGSKP